MKNSKRLRSTVGLGLCAVGLAMAGHPARATNHDVGITEIGAGINGDATAQFIEIRMLVEGQNLWGPQPGESASRAKLVFFDGSGAKTGEFLFTGNAPDRENRFVLLGTTSFKNLTSQPDPDIIIPALMKAPGGRVCFQTNEANTNALTVAECVAYGNFPAAQNKVTVNGTLFSFGTPVAAQLPTSGFSSISRREDGTMIFGFGFKDTDDNNGDFFLTSGPNPTPAGETPFNDSQADIDAGRVLFSQETFGGNGRTCATCHVLTLNGALPPSNVAQRLGTLSTTFDPLFIAEPNMNLNTLTVDAQVSFNVNDVLTGTAGGASAKVKVRAKLSGTQYLVSGGIAPALTVGTNITNGAATAKVVSIVKGDLDGLESPQKMRGASVSANFPQGRGLILENIDGFDKAPVFRKSPHMQNLKFTGPYGFSHDIQTLEEFAVGAVKQHFTRSLARRPGIDFRLPTDDEQRLLKVFMRSLDSVPGTSLFSRFALGNFARTSAQKRGRDLFVSQGCNRCHFGAVLAGGSSFQTGINTQPIDGPAPGGDGLPMDSNPPGGPTNRAISVPGLFNVKNNAPFFHEASRVNVLDAVNFYISPAFQASPEGPVFPFDFDAAEAADIASFLDGLVARDYIITDSSSGTAVDVTKEGSLVDFGSQFLAAGPLNRTLTVKNTSTTASVAFASPACKVTGPAAATFPNADCSQINGVTLAPGVSKTITVHFDPSLSGNKQATLELATANPTGVDLKGHALGAEVDEIFDVDQFGAIERFTSQTVEGGFFVSEGELRGNTCFTCAAPLGNILTHEFTLPTSFTLSVDALAIDTTSAVNDFAVIFNFQNTGNYYYAAFNERDTTSTGADDVNTNGIFKVVNGTRTQIRDFADTTLPGDFLTALHKIRVEKVKTTIRVFRDDVLMGVVTDSTFAGGKAGVGSFNDDTRFDNFTVRAHVLGEDMTASTNPFVKMLGGTFAVTGGKLQLTSPSTNVSIANGNIAVHPTLLPAGDFEVFVEGNAAATSADVTDDFTVVFNFQNTTNYMFVNFAEANNSAGNGVFRVVNSVVTQIADFTTLTAPGSARRTSVRKTGSNISVFRDGVQMGSTVSDATFSAGQMGVGSRNDAATFDNVFVERPR
jgi:hypothetical protein